MGRGFDFTSSSEETSTLSVDGYSVGRRLFDKRQPAIGECFDFANGRLGRPAAVGIDVEIQVIADHFSHGSYSAQIIIGLAADLHLDRCKAGGDALRGGPFGTLDVVCPHRKATAEGQGPASASEQFIDGFADDLAPSVVASHLDRRLGEPVVFANLLHPPIDAGNVVDAEADERRREQMIDQSLAAHTVSPLQRGMTVASPTPSTPASVPIRTTTKSLTSCRPNEDNIRRSGLSGIRTA